MADLYGIRPPSICLGNKTKRLLVRRVAAKLLGVTETKGKKEREVRRSRARSRHHGLLRRDASHANVLESRCAHALVRALGMRLVRSLGHAVEVLARLRRSP